MEAIRIATEQHEIVIVSERREARFARVWHVPSPSKRGALAGARAVANVLQKQSKTSLVLDVVSREDFGFVVSGLAREQRVPGVGYNREVARRSVFVRR